MKNILLGVAVVGCLILMGKVYAADNATQANATVSANAPVAGKAVNVGNKICPVSGEKVGGDMGPAVSYEYKGKIYNLCCTGCISIFAKDPEKYVQKVEEELKADKEK